MTIQIRKKEQSGLEKVASVAVGIYFLSIFVSYLLSGSGKQLIYYAATVLCVAIYLIWWLTESDYAFNGVIAAFIFLCALTGLLNLVFIGNITLFKGIECAFANTLIALMLLELHIDTRWLLAVFFLSAAYFLAKLLLTGMSSRVLSEYTNNFISLILLFPVVIYYALAERYHERAGIIPAGIMLIVSVLAKGRSGIGASVILLFGVLFSLYREKTREATKSTDMFIIHLVITVACIAVLVASVIFVFRHANVLLEKFLKKGFDNSSRMKIWTEYFDHATGNIAYFLLGVPKKDLLMAFVFGGNTHNSFINIHANNGVMFFVSIVMLIKTALAYFKDKCWISLTCLLAFSFRCCFDNGFWCTKGTTVFMFFLFASLIPYKNQKDPEAA